MAAPGREPDRVGCVAAVADPRDLRDLSSGSSPGGGAAVSAGFGQRREAEREEHFGGDFLALRSGTLGWGLGDRDRVLRGAGTDYLHPSTRGDPRPPDFSGQIRALDGHSGYPVT